MNRKLLTIAIALVILAIVVAPVAATMPPKCPLPPAKPYDSIWTLMQDLQKQITTLTTKVNTIQLTPGPRGPTGPKGDTGVAGPQGPAGTCTNCVCPSGQFVTGFDSAGKLVCGAPPVAGGGTPLPAIVPICQAGTPFDASKYAQNTVQSDPMVFTCNWDGNGRVYISGDKTSLTGVYADDGFTINVQPKGVMFDAPEHWAHQHPVVELTSGMTPGSNTFTLIIQDWMGLSTSYGSSDGIKIDQTPYIIEVNTPAGSAIPAAMSSAVLPSFITKTANGVMVNGTLVKA